MTPAAAPGLDDPYPPEVDAAMRRARALAWWSIAWLLSIIAVMGLVAGQSQAMRSAWIEDCLSLLPPALFLVSTSLEGRPPTRRFPYGMRRWASLAFFAAAAALLAMGGILLWEAALTLIRAERPSIGSVAVLGQEVWLGWPMMLALLYSVVPPVILGRMKRRPAEALADKVLVTDAEMNRADWQTGLAGILGLWGIAWGLWWADALAAGLISLSILVDGAGALRTAVAELVDGAPRALRSAALSDEALVLAERARAIPGARLRLRETGRIVTGVLESPDPADLDGLAEGLGWRVRGLAWRPPERHPADGPGAEPAGRGDVGGPSAPEGAEAPGTRRATHREPHSGDTP